MRVVVPIRRSGVIWQAERLPDFDPLRSRFLIPELEPDCAYCGFGQRIGFIRRVQTTGALCGYVAIRQLNHCKDAGLADLFASRFPVHGGVTYFERALDCCFYPLPDRQFMHGFVIGFDCAHAGDKLPSIHLGALGKGSVYRDFEYVANEVIWLHYFCEVWL